MSAGDTKKELKEAIDSNLNWRQPASHPTDQDLALMESNENWKQILHNNKYKIDSQSMRFQ